MATKRKTKKTRKWAPSDAMVRLRETSDALNQAVDALGKGKTASAEDALATFQERLAKTDDDLRARRFTRLEHFVAGSSIRDLRATAKRVGALIEQANRLAAALPKLKETQAEIQEELRGRELREQGVVPFRRRRTNALKHSLLR